MTKIRAKVRTISETTRHALGEFENGRVVESEQLSRPAWVEISEEDGMFYLLHYNAQGKSFADTCHLTLPEAKSQAEFEFGIPASAWERIS